jgi:hypothetical protein
LAELFSLAYKDSMMASSSSSLRLRIRKSPHIIENKPVAYNIYRIIFFNTFIGDLQRNKKHYHLQSTNWADPIKKKREKGLQPFGPVTKRDRGPFKNLNRYLSFLSFLPLTGGPRVSAPSSTSGQKSRPLPRAVNSPGLEFPLMEAIKPSLATLIRSPRAPLHSPQIPNYSAAGLL